MLTMNQCMDNRKNLKWFTCAITEKCLSKLGRIHKHSCDTHGSKYVHVDIFYNLVFQQETN